MRKKSTMSKPLAPEDIRPGDYVTPLHVTCEYVPSCGDEAMLRAHGPIVLELMPRDVTPPMKVISVCVPFVVVKNEKGERRLLDVRRYRLARVSEDFAREALKQKRAD